MFPVCITPPPLGGWVYGRKRPRRRERLSLMAVVKEIEALARGQMGTKRAKVGHTESEHRRGVRRVRLNRYGKVYTRERSR